MDCIASVKFCYCAFQSTLNPVSNGKYFLPEVYQRVSLWVSKRDKKAYDRFTLDAEVPSQWKLCASRSHSVHISPWRSTSGSAQLPFPFIDSYLFIKIIFTSSIFTWQLLSASSLTLCLFVGVFWHQKPHRLSFYQSTRFFMCIVCLSACHLSCILFRFCLDSNKFTFINLNTLFSLYKCFFTGLKGTSMMCLLVV